MKVKARSSQALLLMVVALVAVISIAAVAVGATTDDAAPSAPSASLTDGEIEGIMFMRQEEKLAHDVYVTFADMYGQPVFSNIASAETQHLALVLALIEAYDLDDPIDGSPVGEFANQGFQDLYDGMIADGSVDLAAALEVGAVIEEIDILDLERYLGDTPNPDIIMVYDSLLRGSQNHLRAFVSQIEANGGNRQPVRMEQDAYDAILASGMQRGDGSGAGHGQGGCTQGGQGQHGQGQHGQSG